MKKIFAVLCVILVLTISFMMGDQLSKPHMQELPEEEYGSEIVTNSSLDSSTPPEFPQNEETFNELIDNLDSFDSPDAVMVEPEKNHEVPQNSPAELKEAVEAVTIPQESKVEVSDERVPSQEITTVEENDTIQEASSSNVVQESIIPDEQTVTLSVSCRSILNHIDMLNPEKKELVPKDGIILATSKVSFQEGDTAFDVLKREMMARKIHLEFNYTPMYHSVYIEGIQNIYEFDCGNLSGWMYRVNGVVPKFASSEYTLKENDVLEFLYTCDLGNDIASK